MTNNTVNFNSSVSVHFNSRKNWWALLRAAIGLFVFGKVNLILHNQEVVINPSEIFIGEWKINDE